jgi:thioredoxin 1
VREVTDATFEEEVLRAGRATIVDFWAPWCKPCQAIEPILEALAADHELGLVRLNIDEHIGVPSRYGVLSLPTVILFEGGEPRTTVVGARPRHHFERAFADWLVPPSPIRGSSNG